MTLNEEQPLLLPDSEEKILVRPGPPSPQSDAENIVRQMGQYRYLEQYKTFITILRKK